jgi:hypothetical protein
MASQSRQRATKNLTRRERRSGVARSYSVPAQVATVPRRSYMAEPAPVDYSAEYRYIRKDLFRILLWASILIVGMIVLAFLPIF